MEAGITSTSSPNVKEVTWFPKLKEGPFFAFHIIEVKLLQPSKASSPMLVTLFPIVTDVKPVHPEKARSPMLVTLFGISIEVKPVQPWKA